MKKENKTSPIAEADTIVNKRSEERDRQYGGFTEAMIKTAKIATELCNKEITTEDAFKVLMALKLSRLSHSPKFDSFVDLIGYTEGWWNYLEEKELLDVQQRQAEWQDTMTVAAGTKPHSEHCECKDCRDKPHSGRTLECEMCDGVGWYEGGPHLRTTCETCGGTGRVPAPNKPNPIRRKK
jgi:hypothetical protein